MRGMFALRVHGGSAVLAGLAEFAQGHENRGFRLVWGMVMVVPSPGTVLRPRA